MTLITVLFDESRAGLGSRNSKIGTKFRSIEDAGLETAFFAD
jgi:hypothetical protein